MKKIKFLVFILLLLLPISIIKADTVDLYLFYGDGCPHCAEEEEFLDEYLKDKDDVVLNKYEVWHNTDNQEILRKVQDAINNHASGVPYLVIGNKSIVGYYEGVTNLQIEEQIEKTKNQKNFTDRVKKVLNKENIETNDRETITVYFFKDDSEESKKIELYINNIAYEEEIGNKFNIKIYDLKKEELNNNIKKKVIEKLKIEEDKIPLLVIGDKYINDFSSMDKINELINSEYENKKYKDIVSDLDTTEIVPFFGKIDATDISLPILTIVLGFIDGFNPCATWILVFLITMLINMKDIKKMWILGLTFILTSGLMYALFMVAWLNAASYIGGYFYIRLIVALFSLGIGIFNIYNFIKSLKKEDGCNVVNKKNRKKIMQKVMNITTNKKFIASLLGIIVLAITVNLIEAMCSLSIPVLYANILSMNNLSTPVYALYIFLYILFFLIDDIIIFAAAMITFKVTGISTKFTKYSHLIAGIITIIIGLLLIFNPGLLMSK